MLQTAPRGRTSRTGTRSQERGIMEAATKKKRGRPNKWSTDYYSLVSDMEKRRAQNFYYASITISLIKQKPGEFFVTKKGNFRRIGIAEQIGRMKEANITSDEELIKLTQTCIDEYNNGATIKDIEKNLRHLRLLYTNGDK